MQAESEEEGFHESEGKQKLDGEVVLSKKHLQEKCFTLICIIVLLHSQHYNTLLQECTKTF